MLPADAQYAANIALMQQQPAMEGLLTQMAMQPLVNLQLLPGPSGDLTGVAWDVPTQSWIPLCDLINPIGEAVRAAGQIWSPDATVFTLIGLGLGYAVAAFAEKLLPYQRLVVWEYDAALFKAMLYAIDIAPLFSGKRVEVVVGTDTVAKVEPWYLTLEAHEKLHMALP